MQTSIRRAFALPALASALLATSALAQLPAEVDAPEEALVLKLHGVGAQLYECKAGADGKLVWTFREPVATLMLDGHSIGQHYRGPTFEHIDGSAIVIKPTASAPSPDGKSIPWLRADVVDRRGTGALSAATTVQRINTPGGRHGRAVRRSGRGAGGALRGRLYFSAKRVVTHTNNPAPPRYFTASFALSPVRSLR